MRNDRLIAVAANSHAHQGISSLKQLNASRLDEIEHFFVSYNMAKGKRFTVLGRSGPERARELVEQGARK